ncbi:MAG: 1-acyl-sn-glycerol-3-phosphate acyltransferase [Clostridia bacterium]|nr:1-acyl-sn-glycerol-3-phosphate acyltransferase [Clostridia bacterium]
MTDKVNNYNFSEFKKRNLMNVIRPIGNLFCKTYYKVEYIGLENIERNDGFIIAPNHITEFDPLLIAMASKRLFYYIGKYELFKNPILAKAITGLNGFPVMRGKGDMRAINYAVELIRRGEVLCIFPEGTRSVDGTPKTAKSGVGYIARHSKCDVIPTSIYMENKDKKGSKVTVKFGEPIRYDDMGFTVGGKTSENKRVAKRVMDEITRLWEECK